MKTYDSNYALAQPYGYITIVNMGFQHEYKIGHYTFRHGTVRIYYEPKVVILDFVYNSRRYSRHIREIKKQLSDRSLMIYAGKFGREIVKSLNNQ